MIQAPSALSFFDVIAAKAPTGGYPLLEKNSVSGEAPALNFTDVFTREMNAGNLSGFTPSMQTPALPLPQDVVSTEGLLLNRSTPEWLFLQNNFLAQAQPTTTSPTDGLTLGVQDFSFDETGAAIVDSTAESDPVQWIEEARKPVGTITTPINPTVTAPLENSLSVVGRQRPTDREILLPFAARMAEINNDTKNDAVGRFSPLQGGVGQVQMGAELSEMRRSQEIQSNEALQQIAELVQERTGIEGSVVMKDITDVLLRRTSQGEEQALTAMFEKAQLKVDFEQGIVRDLAAEKVMTSGSGPLLLTQPVEQIEQRLLSLINAIQASETSDELRQGVVRSQDKSVLTESFAPQHLVSDLSDVPVAIIPVTSNASAGNNGDSELSDFQRNKKESGLSKIPLSPSAGVDQLLNFENVSSDFSSDTATALSSQVGQAGLAKAMARPSSLSLQMVESVQVLVKDGGGTMKVQLNPVELGKMELQVTQDAQGIHLQAFTERADVAEQMKRDLPDLVSKLEQQGIYVKTADVSTASTAGQAWTHSQDGNARQGGQEQFLQRDQWNEFQERAAQQERSSQEREQQKFFDAMDLVA